VAHGIKAETAGHVFDLVEKFAGYGFNKSHSAAYALVAYQTAWLKAHYPAAFMAAVLSADMDNTDKVVMLINEARALGLEVLPPHVNASDYPFTVDQARPDQAIRYGLGAIKGAGVAALLGIVAERVEHGEYTDLFDFCRRIDLRKCNRRVLDALIKAGALDGQGPDRGIMLASLDTALQLAEKHAQSRTSGQNDIFGLLGGSPPPLSLREKGEGAESEGGLPYASHVPWSAEDQLAGEKDTLGLYLTGHPIDRWLGELRNFTKPLNAVRPERRQSVKVAGLIVNLRTMNSRRGKMAAITLDDKSARLEVVLYSDIFTACRDLLGKDKIVVVEGEISEDEFNGGYSMTAAKLWDLEQARETFAKKLNLSVCAKDAGNGLVKHLAQTLKPYRQGRCPVYLEYRGKNAQATLLLGQSWQVRPDEALLQSLREMVGEERVRMMY
jgi:DNA polymerase-3 subunit alpha